MQPPTMYEVLHLVIIVAVVAWLFVYFQPPWCFTSEYLNPQGEFIALGKVCYSPLQLEEF